MVESRWLIWDMQIEVVKIEQVEKEKVKMLLDYLDIQFCRRCV